MDEKKLFVDEEFVESFDLFLNLNDSKMEKISVVLIIDKHSSRIEMNRLMKKKRKTE